MKFINSLIKKQLQQNNEILINLLIKTNKHFCDQNTVQYNGSTRLYSMSFIVLKSNETACPTGNDMPATKYE